MDFDRKPARSFLGCFRQGLHIEMLFYLVAFFHRNEPQPFCPVMHSLKGQGSFCHFFVGFGFVCKQDSV